MKQFQLTLTLGNDLQTGPQLADLLQQEAEEVRKRYASGNITEASNWAVFSKDGQAVGSVHITNMAAAAGSRSAHS